MFRRKDVKPFINDYYNMLAHSEFRVRTNIMHFESRSSLSAARTCTSLRSLAIPVMLMPYFTTV